MNDIIEKIKLFWEELPQNIAFRLLPRSVAYWAFVRVAVHASSVHSARHIDSLTPAECLKAWKNHP